MSEVCEVNVVLQGTSGLPGDQYVNTFHVESLLDFSDLSTIAPAIRDFYNVAGPTGTKVAGWISGRASRVANASKIKIYNLVDLKPRTPKIDFAWTLEPANVVPNLPEEVALCLSYRGEPQSGSPAARRRGRIYLGPLNRDSALATAGNEDRPKTSEFVSLLGAAQRLQTALKAAQWQWVVYSRVGPTGPVDPSRTTPISYAWIDNAFDTQRRRGQKATTRTSQVITL